MAKRRRLSTFGIADGPAADDDVGAEKPDALRPMAPVSRIAGDAATQSALNELAHEFRQARETGRMIVELPLDAIDTQHLTRDRLSLEPDDMDALVGSIRDRGQQTPIEVTDLGGGRYGLISGARRLNALQHLAQATQSAQFSKVRAVLRPGSTVADHYLAMVEENEIRSDLSFYERGRLAHEAARIGVFDSPAVAVRMLFIHVSPSKRSKILNFVALHEALGQALKFPDAIPEKLGLALVKALERDPLLTDAIMTRLAKVKPESAAAERSVLDQCLTANKAETVIEAIPMAHASIDHRSRSGIRVHGTNGRVVLSGKQVTDTLIGDLIAWLNSR